ncbi:MAG: RidA family protein [Candidatus Hadarchaeum sp.]|uniref:RidA family protein n=1 Tax=Candidatus Hadarchaeum sp. TaxID=2883567 RepID=UPI00316F2C20
MGVIEARLESIGLKLPAVPRPVGEYIPAKRVGDLVFVSGQGPVLNGKPVYVGRVGAEISLEDAYKAAQLAVLNCLAAIKALVSSLDKVEEIIQVRGFVNSSPDFYDQPKVLNGASELLVNLFGERGRHARAALGTSVLPGNIPVEIEMIARIKEG